MPWQSGDAAADWFLDHLEVPFAFVCMYLAALYFGQKYMADKAPFKLQTYVRRPAPLAAMQRRSSHTLPSLTQSGSCAACAAASVPWRRGTSASASSAPLPCCARCRTCCTTSTSAASTTRYARHRSCLGRDACVTLGPRSFDATRCPCADLHQGRRLVRQRGPFLLGCRLCAV